MPRNIDLAAGVVGKDSITTGAENITTGKTFGQDDTNGPVSGQYSACLIDMY